MHKLLKNQKNFNKKKSKNPTTGNICNRCVRTYDHHCPWIGTCCGEDNRPYFLTFVFLQWLELCFYFTEACDLLLAQSRISARPLGLRFVNTNLFLGLGTFFICVFIIMLTYIFFLGFFYRLFLPT